LRIGRVNTIILIIGIRGEKDVANNIHELISKKLKINFKKYEKN